MYLQQFVAHIYKTQALGLPVKIEAQVDTLCLLTQPWKELQPDLKTNNTQNSQNIKPYGGLTTKDLKKTYSFRQEGGVESWTWVDRWCGMERQWWWNEQESYLGKEQSQARPHSPGFQHWENRKWIKKLWYIYMMEYYTAERKKEVLPL